MPPILAPIFFRQFATSTTSGSRAAFSISVSPRASTAAINALWVAPTETLESVNLVAGQSLRRLGDDIAALELDLGAERLKRGQMQIDGPRADGAASGQ